MTERTRPLKVGISLPFGEGRMAGQTPRWSDLRDMAQTAEDVGFDSIWLPDHLLFRADGRSQGTWECWTLLSALAAVTTRIEIAPFVSCVAFRNPALLAKMADTLDEISGGRLILGIGAGWNEVEFTAFGLPFDHRVSRFEEAITIISTLLRTGRIDYVGSYYAARECELRPRGPRPTGPPILVCTAGSRMLRLVARFADAWGSSFPQTGNSVAGIGPLRRAVDDACRDVGRDPASLTRMAYVFVGLPGGLGVAANVTPLTGRADELSKEFQGSVTPLIGSKEQIAEELHAYAREGISHVQLWLDPRTADGIEAFAPVLEILDRYGASPSEGETVRADDTP